MQCKPSQIRKCKTKTMRTTKYRNYKIIPCGDNYIVQMPNGTKWSDTPLASKETCKQYINVHIYEIANRNHKNKTCFS